MARRFPRWADLRPPQRNRPLTASEQREYHAVRLALILALGVMQAGAFVCSRQPLPGDVYDHWRWYRQALAPLRRRSPTVGMAIRLINLEGPRIGWDDPIVVRRHLRRLAEESVRWARLPAQSPPVSRLPRARS